MKTGKYIAIAAFFAFALAAAPAFAQTYPYTYPTYPMPSAYSGYPAQVSCPQLSYNLYTGLSDYYTGGQVSQLQQFFAGLGYYQPVTGYFGSVTANNVAQFQQSHGVYPVTGGVGPLTRAAIMSACGGSNGGYTGGISITNVSGPTSLAVGQTGTWSITTNAPYGSHLSTSVRWGDENLYGYAMPQAATAYTNQQNSFTHNYAAAGTFTITFTVTDSYGRSQSATAQVTVSGGSTCGYPYTTSNCCNTYPYASAGNCCTTYPYTTNTGNCCGSSNCCGSYNCSGLVTISSLSPTQGPVGTLVAIQGSGFTQNNVVHFGSGGKMQVPSQNNGTLIYFTIPANTGPCDVEQTFAVCPQYEQVVTPGTYQIYVTNENGQSQAQNFTVTSGSTCNTINCNASITANPQSGYAPLMVTFTVNNYSGTYAVNFGDGTSASLQSGSVTHVYSSRGTYTAQFTSDPQCFHTTPTCYIAVQNLGSVAVTVY